MQPANVNRYQHDSLLGWMSPESDFFQKINDVRIVAAILHKTKEWTNGLPFLDQIIYSYVDKYSGQIIQELGGEGVVDEIVRHKIIKNWENNAAASQLKLVRQDILSCEDLDLLLILYLRILQQGAVAVRNFPEEQAVLQSGLARLDDRELKPANAIYTHIFDISWVEQQLLDITHTGKVVES